MCAQKLSFDYAHTLHTVRIVHNTHSVHRSQVPNRQSCDCINFVRATDPFLGSGSTLIAGEKTDHVCRGIEFDPKFVDVIVKRYIVNIKWLFCAEVEVFSCPILPKGI